MALSGGKQKKRRKVSTPKATKVRNTLCSASLKCCCCWKCSKACLQLAVLRKPPRTEEEEGRVRPYALG